MPFFCVFGSMELSNSSSERASLRTSGIRMNLVEPILYQCKLNPFATAIATPGSGLGLVKYGQLETLIHNVARSALRTGLAPGQTAALLIVDAIVHAGLVLG